MKAREERQKVMISARMRCGGSWSDVCVLNVSRGGLGIQAAEPPRPGTYVELRRGPVLVVARVIWTNGQRAGLCSREPIWIEGLLSETRSSIDQELSCGGLLIERRQQPRPGDRQESSRHAGRAMEFAFLLLAAAGLGAISFGIVEQALAEPMARIEAALNPQQD